MRSKSILSGINVPIEPTSNVDSHVTNSIHINIDKADQSQRSTEVLAPIPEGETGEEVKAIYPGVTREVTVEDNPYANLPDQTAQLRGSTSVDEYLRSLYETILLSNDKTLIANLISKNNIILTKEDLEQVIKRKVGKDCTVDLDVSDISCCGIKTPFIKISAIRVIDGDGKGNDLKILYNTDYQELIVNYHLNLKYVLAN